MALEKQSCDLPLDLRREEISVRECCKIMSKDDTSLLKQTLNEYRNEITDDKVTPITKMIREVCEMETLTEINTKSIEPEVTYMEYISPSRSKPTYWNNLGSCKNR
ncbi:hypothetical protein DPMN_170340 [Dreissena polymorpha]|uniref:Uncharacterized protein n=1 Tax=Dreissena polymorpha TaxID=45954 RepID=A0A9D4DXN1_DREPO|nr:hypothetical protein DPMN_170340 [Dreissena polymorpha]